MLQFRGAKGLLGALLIGGAFVSPAFAQIPALDAIERQQNRLQQQNLDRERARLRELEQQRRTPPRAQPAAPASAGLVRGNGCVEVRRIAIEGARAISAPRLHDLVSGSEGKCLTLADLDGVLRALTNRYVEGGYVTSRAYLPEQDLADGVLLVVVVEGVIERFQYNRLSAGESAPPVRPAPADGSSPSEVVAAFPGLEGKVLDLRDLEQGLDQMNRLLSNNARLRLEPGSAAGSSVVMIDNAPGPRWRSSLGIDNTGSAGTGRGMGSVGLELDNVAGLNDFWTFSARHTLGGDSGLRNSQSYSGMTMVPIGPVTLRLGGSWYTYRTTVFTPTQRFASTGSTATATLGADVLVHRDDVSKTSVVSSLTVRQVRNYIEDVRLRVSSPNLAPFELGVTHDRRLFGGVFGAAVRHQWGLDAFNATADDARIADGPRAQFRAWTAELQYSRRLGAQSSPFAWSAYAFGQWSGDRLYGSQQVSLGGLYTVRGFRDEALAGSTGFYLRNELSYAIPMPENEHLRRIFGQVSVFVGYDIGALRAYRDSLYERGTLQGAAIGLRAAGGAFNFDLTFGIPIDAPAFIDKEDFEVYAAASLRF